jgi:hypothetical protein
LVAFDKVWGHMELVINHLMTIIFSTCFTLVIGVCLLLILLLLSIYIFTMDFILFLKTKLLIVNDQKNHYWAPCWQTRLGTIIFTIIKTSRCGINKIKRPKIKTIVQSSPNFSECYSSLGFIHCRTEAKHYDTPKHTSITRCRNKCN